LDNRHSVRIGWGDMIYESAVFRPSLNGAWTNPDVLPADYIHDETFDFGYTGHDIDAPPSPCPAKCCFRPKAR